MTSFLITTLAVIIIMVAICHNRAIQRANRERAFRQQRNHATPVCPMGGIYP